MAKIEAAKTNWAETSLAATSASRLSPQAKQPVAPNVIDNKCLNLFNALRQCLRWGLFSATSAFLISSNAATAEPCCAHAELSLTLTSQHHSEPVSIQAWSDDWQSDYQPGERAHSFTQIRVMYQTTLGWRFGSTSRLDYNITFSEDTARLYFEDSNGLLAETPESSLSLTIQHLRASGATVGYQIHLGDAWSFGIDVTRLRAHDLYEGYINGVYAITADQQYLFDAQIDYAYQNDALLNRPGTDATLGWGWATDLHARWQSADNRWHLRLDLQDAWTRITWKDVPFTQARLNTANQIEDGSIRFEPTLEGKESFRQLRQGLPIRTRLLAEYALGYYLTTHFSAETLPVATEWGAGITLAAPGPELHTLTLSALMPMGALQLQHRYGGLYWGLGMDSLDWRKAHWLKLELGLAMLF